MKPRFKYMGCYQDDGGWRTMERILDSPKLTVKICIAECKERGFRFAGIQVSLWQVLNPSNAEASFVQITRLLNTI